MSLEDKHLEHLAQIQAYTDFSWHSWNSPIGLGIAAITSSLAVVLLTIAFYILRSAILLH